MKRNLTLRPYQLPVSKFAMSNNLSVLALAPGGGKTEISIDIIEKFLTANPKKRVLVLAHSTKVLKDNYTDRLNELNVSFTYSTDLKSNAQVHICLPQQINQIKGKYPLFIVDEAHENYLEKRVQEIRAKISPKKEILLTGTPSKFVLRKDIFKNIHCLAANEIPKEFFAKLSIELVATKYNWFNNLNSEWELNNSAIMTQNQTEQAMSDILISLISRVKKQLPAEEFNKTKKGFGPCLRNAWKSLTSEIGKTLIVCKTIKQATDVNDILQKNNVSSTISHSENDAHSKNVSDFKNNHYDVLVVVNRARLGYSDTNLFNIIDMSGSHNPDVIYQIFARALRGNSFQQKFYLKITTQEPGMRDFSYACLCAALMLTDNEYLSTFNGKNFKNILIPVLKKDKKKSRGKGTTNGKASSKFIYPEFTLDCIDLMRNIIANFDNPASIYKGITIGEVWDTLRGINNWTEENIFASIEGTL